MRRVLAVYLYAMRNGTPRSPTRTSIVGKAGFCACAGPAGARAREGEQHQGRGGGRPGARGGEAGRRRGNGRG